MPRVTHVIALWLLLGQLPVRADDALARQTFDAGVTATEENRWADAARLFEASLGESDKLATRFNLILAYHALDRPLDLARHALHLLASPDRSRREEARSQATELLADALRKLAVLNLSALPADSQLQVDGRVPSLVRDAKMYLLPGVHHLELRLGPSIYEAIEISLNAGHELAWPRLGRGSSQDAVEAVPPAPAAMTAAAPKPINQRLDVSPTSIRRTRAAWAIGGIGAALTVAAGSCLLAASRQADQLAEGGIPGTTKPGYYDAVDQYHRTLNAVVPMALTGGALMAGAVLVGERAILHRSLAWSIASAATGLAMFGLGAYLFAREPGLIIPTAEEFERPARESGSLLFAAGLPLLTYGIASPLLGRRKVHTSAGFATARFVW